MQFFPTWNYTSYFHALSFHFTTAAPKFPNFLRQRNHTFPLLKRGTTSSTISPHPPHLSPRILERKLPELRPLSIPHKTAAIFINTPPRTCKHVAAPRAFGRSPGNRLPPLSRTRRRRGWKGDTKGLGVCGKRGKLNEKANELIKLLSIVEARSIGSSSVCSPPFRLVVVVRPPFSIVFRYLACAGRATVKANSRPRNREHAAD